MTEFCRRDRSRFDTALQASQLLSLGASFTRDPDVYLACQVGALAPLLTVKGLRGLQKGAQELLDDPSFLDGFATGGQAVLDTKIAQLRAEGIDTSALEQFGAALAMLKTHAQTQMQDDAEMPPMPMPPMPRMPRRGVIGMPVQVTQDPDGVEVVTPHVTNRELATHQELRIDLPGVVPGDVRLSQTARGLFLDVPCDVPLQGYGTDPGIVVAAPFRFRGFLDRYMPGIFGPPKPGTTVRARWDDAHAQLVVEVGAEGLAEIQPIPVEADTARAYPFDKVAVDGPIILPGTTAPGASPAVAPPVAPGSSAPSASPVLDPNLPPIVG